MSLSLFVGLVCVVCSASAVLFVAMLVQLGVATLGWVAWLFVVLLVQGTVSLGLGEWFSRNSFDRTVSVVSGSSMCS